MSNSEMGAVYVVRRAPAAADAVDLAQPAIVYAIYRGLDLIFASAETHLFLRLQLIINTFTV